MSLRHEQYRAMRAARDFLRDLLAPATTPRTRRELRRRAAGCLRHYPFLDRDGRPMFSRDGVGAEERDGKGRHG